MAISEHGPASHDNSLEPEVTTTVGVEVATTAHSEDVDILWANSTSTKEDFFR